MDAYNSKFLVLNVLSEPESEHVLAKKSEYANLWAEGQKKSFHFRKH